MGSTVVGPAVAVVVEDHPHIHGEHESGCTILKRSMGSPPYTWGALNLIYVGQALKGITPIYMGST